MANQSIQRTINEVVEQNVLKVTQLIEDKIDEKLQDLEELTSDDIENLRERRLMEMKRQQKLRQEFLAKGHGEYEELKQEKDFFDVIKKSDNVVLHFYRLDTPRCKIVDHHLQILAKSHVETRFCKLLADNAMFLTGRLGIRIIPTIVLIKKGNVKDYIIGFTDLGNCDDFSTEMLEWRLALSTVINYDGDLLHPPDKKRATKQSSIIQKSSIRDRADYNDDCSDLDSE